MKAWVKVEGKLEKKFKDVVSVGMAPNERLLVIDLNDGTKIVYPIATVLYYGYTK